MYLLTRFWLAVQSHRGVDSSRTEKQKYLFVIKRRKADFYSAIFPFTS